MEGWQILTILICAICAGVAGNWVDKAIHQQPELDANGMEEGFEQDLDFGPNADTGQIVDGEA